MFDYEPTSRDARRPEVTAVVAESVGAVRAGIVRLLTHELGVQVNHAGPDLDEALEEISATRPSLAMIDRDLPGCDVLEGLSLAREQSPRTRIVLTASAFSNAEIVSALELGVRGCILKSDSMDEFRFTTEEVLAGRVVLSRRVCEQLMARSQRNSGGGHTSNRLEGLTRREIQVLAHIAEGLSIKEIATTLNVSIKTVEGHKANVMAKLDIHDRVLLAHHAIREGLVSVWSGDGAR